MYLYITNIFYIHSFSVKLANPFKNTYLLEIGLFRTYALLQWRLLKTKTCFNKKLSIKFIYIILFLHTIQWKLWLS